MMITDVPIFDRDLRKASTLRPVTYAAKSRSLPEWRRPRLDGTVK
jgi:hypothetical protein